MHDILDFFSLLVAILALVALFIDPAGTRRAQFLRIGLSISVAILVVYGAYEFVRAKEERLLKEAEVKNKERQVVDLLCREGQVNYEQLFNETSQGFSDEILNEAIDDLAQRQGVLATKWVQIGFPISNESHGTHASTIGNTPPNPITVRFYYLLDPVSCRERMKTP